MGVSRSLSEPLSTHIAQEWSTGERRGHNCLSKGREDNISQYLEHR